MRYRVRHSTVYDYEQDVSVSHHIARLTPRQLAHQVCLEHRLETTPAAATRATHEDHFGNRATFLTIESPHRRLEITSSAIVEITAPKAVAAEASPAWEQVRDSFAPWAPDSPVEPAEFLFASPLITRRPEFAQYAAESFRANRPIVAAAQDLAGRIHRDFKFDGCATSVGSSVSDFFKARRGVCQDFAQFMLACVRSLGLPGRYVSGYLETLPPPGQPRLAGADASHAWVALWAGPLGWMDIDPTNNALPSGRHMTVAWGRDFSDVSPVRGTIVGGGSHRLLVAVDVIPDT